MRDLIQQTATALRANALAVCRHYLGQGRLRGVYWIIGDVFNTPGRSLYVHLRRGKWCDAATGDHGDLLDLIAMSRGIGLSEALKEARDFLAMPQTASAPMPLLPQRDTAAMASRMFQAAYPLAGTLGEVYLRTRGIAVLPDAAAVRFAPKLAYRLDRETPFEHWPGLVSASRDTAGKLTGIQRLWLSKDGRSKASVRDPRRALGKLLGSAVRLEGTRREVLVIGEGLETVLALKTACPELAMAAALSARHLAAVTIPEGLPLLAIAADNDSAGLQAAASLAQRARAKGMRVSVLIPERGDFNDDLLAHGRDRLRRRFIRELDLVVSAEAVQDDEEQARLPRQAPGLEDAFPS